MCVSQNAEFYRVEAEAAVEASRLVKERLQHVEAEADARLSALESELLAERGARQRAVDECRRLSEQVACSIAREQSIDGEKMSLREALLASYAATTATQQKLEAEAAARLAQQQRADEATAALAATDERLRQVLSEHQVARECLDRGTCRVCATRGGCLAGRLTWASVFLRASVCRRRRPSGAFPHRGGACHPRR
jgi:hypothetical protein